MFMSEKIRKEMAEDSWIRRMFDEGNILKKKYGADKVFDLTLGNPIVEPPAEFKGFKGQFVALGGFFADRQ